MPCSDKLGLQVFSTLASLANAPISTRYSPAWRPACSMALPSAAWPASMAAARLASSALGFSGGFFCSLLGRLDGWFVGRFFPVSGPACRQPSPPVCCPWPTSTTVPGCRLGLSSRINRWFVAGSRQRFSAAFSPAFRQARRRTSAQMASRPARGMRISTSCNDLARLDDPSPWADYGNGTETKKAAPTRRRRARFFELQLSVVVFHVLRFLPQRLKRHRQPCRRIQRPVILSLSEACPLAASVAAGRRIAGKPPRPQGRRRQ